MATISVAALFSCNQSVNAQSPEDFYRNKTVTFIVGLPPGGSFDLYARLIAGHVGRHIPGKPNVIVQNMPGAGSLQQANHVYNVAPQDGTVVGAPSSNVPLQPLLNVSGVRYDSRKFQWLPTPVDAPHTLFVWHTSPVQRVEDMRERETLIGSLAPGSTPTVMVGIYNAIFGTKMRAVTGYTGLPSVMLAIERGEVEGYSTMPYDTLRHNYRAHLESGKIRILLQSGDTRMAALPDVPTARELARTPEDRELLTLVQTTSRMTFPYVMGPSVPADRVAAMRAAIMAALADPELQKEAAAREMRINPVSSETVTKLIADAFASPAPIVERLRAIYQQHSK